MLHIAICDDQQDQLAGIAAYVHEYLELDAIDAKVSLFLHPDELLTACARERFHIYILDILMPMLNGIEVGKDIRHLDKEAQIIYVTAEPSFALNAFCAHPINYLLKPIVKQQLFDSLALAVSLTDLLEEVMLAIKTKEGVHTLRICEIACCEYSHRRVIYRLINGGQLETSTLVGRFSEHIAPLLHSGYFLQPHISFAVNLRRVERFCKEHFMLRGGLTVPISKKLYSEVRDDYLNYVLGKKELL
ncbi:LytTR family DNA-binding domain-containing protein [Anaerocolumna sp. AGMB13020]|uniref:LytR/AlgR family response regulator transcription factor n=1 Tax=Anaerocolumna sp. AGMB13020 TaxID=3081750 RepID=UPI002955CE83|nr:LytTR family DNA-binding domain-containing protein [Anaerocolumna sp. AGMB13020]WOO38850.1 LytTR family DNA-binding domain-containing protein [Anaerocolumna sp. AGMB13020]